MSHKELAIVMPVYNEEGSIEKVLTDWMRVLDHEEIDYDILVLNDGSKDLTATILQKLGAKYSHLKIIQKSNSGHGPTIIQGYQVALNYTFTFQTDSDDELPADYFKQLWKNRHKADFIIGKRQNRSTSVSRQLISWVARLTLQVFYGDTPFDVNCPYRLFKSETFRGFIQSVPADTFAPNVLLCGQLGLEKIPYIEVSIPYQPRQTGEVSIQRMKLLKAAVRSFWQTICFRFKQL